MRALLLLVPALLLDPAAAEEAPVPLPPAATAILEKFTRAEEKLAAEHAQAVIAERTKAIDALGKVLKDTTRTGNLDAANAVKARIDALRAANAAEMPTDLLGAARGGADLAKLIVGEWDMTKRNGPSGTLKVSPDGTATLHVLVLTFTARWEVLKDPTTRAKRIRFTWDSPEHWDDVVSITGDKAEGDSWDAGKGAISLRRKK
jgi:hypothetical protein